MIDASGFAEFEISEFEISRVYCMFCFLPSFWLWPLVEDWLLTVKNRSTVHFILVCQRLFGNIFIYYLLFLAETSRCVSTFLYDQKRKGQGHETPKMALSQIWVILPLYVCNVANVQKTHNFLSKLALQFSKSDHIFGHNLYSDRYLFSCLKSHACDFLSPNYISVYILTYLCALILVFII